MKLAIILFDLNNKIDILLKSIRENIKISFDVDYYIFAKRNIDSDYNGISNIFPISDVIYTKDNRFPLKYITINKYKHKLISYDYLLCITDMISIRQQMDETTLNNNLISILHPGFFDKPRRFFTYENNTSSSAYVSHKEGLHYFFDVLIGGKKNTFWKFIDKICDYRKKDEKLGIIPVWGEESYLNKYLLDYPPDKILGIDFIEINNGPINNKENKNDIIIEKEIIKKESKKKKSKSPPLPISPTIINGKKDLSDLTFMIPIKIDSRDRVENLTLLLEYLNHNFKTNILVTEESLSPSLSHLSKYCTYLHITPILDCFYRTHLLNIMIGKSDTPYVANYDCDIFLNVKAYGETMERLRKKEFDVIYPFQYNTRFPRSLVPIIRRCMNMDQIKSTSVIIIKKQCFGCCVFVNKEKYIWAGMENENFKSWGPEDYERHERFQKLGLKIGRLNEYYSFHLEHRRGKDSDKANPYFHSNELEYLKIKNMSADQIKRYMKTWSWLNK